MPEVADPVMFSAASQPRIVVVKSALSFQLLMAASQSNPPVTNITTAAMPDVLQLCGGVAGDAVISAVLSSLLDLMLRSTIVQSPRNIAMQTRTTKLFRVSVIDAWTKKACSADS